MTTLTGLLLGVIYTANTAMAQVDSIVPAVTTTRNLVERGRSKPYGRPSHYGRVTQQDRIVSFCLSVHGRKDQR